MRRQQEVPATVDENSHELLFYLYTQSRITNFRAIFFLNIFVILNCTDVTTLSVYFDILRSPHVAFEASCTPGQA